MKKILITILVALLCHGVAPAQIRQVYIGVNGLTCSQCTRNVEMQVRRLPFVEQVDMNLEHTNGVVTLKADKPFKPEAIAQAVRDAGFSVRYLKLGIAPPDEQTLRSGCIAACGLTLQLVSDEPVATDSGLLVLQVLGKAFQAGKDETAGARRKCPGKLYFVKPAHE